MIRRSSLLVFLSVLALLPLAGVFRFTTAASSPRLAAQSGAAEKPFAVPQWTSFRIRMDDTLTTKYSIEGDPFSATVMDSGEYQGSRVYGVIQTIDNSGRFRGHTTMILAFNRLVMPDGRRAPISAEIVKLYHAPDGESVDVEGAIESGGRGKKSFINTGLGAGAGALLGGIFGGGRGAGLGAIIGGACGIGTTAFTGPQVIVISRGLEMLIRVTGPGPAPAQ